MLKHTKQKKFLGRGEGPCFSLLIPRLVSLVMNGCKNLNFIKVLLLECNYTEMVAARSVSMDVREIALRICDLMTTQLV